MNRKGIMISKALIDTILSQYALPINGIHGVSHWARVLENGRLLTVKTGANAQIVELFSIFHDARRTNDGLDYKHGRQGAELAKTLRGTLIDLNDEDFELLYVACAGHTKGYQEADVTVQTCWDSDRLDLGRVGIRPNPQRLCTPAARNPDLIAWAEERGRAFVRPDLIRTEWGVEL
jgi:uncharacterized protein